MILNEYSYIVVPERTGALYEDVKRLLIENGRPKTLEHVKDVADACARIAGQYGLDREACRAAGLLHDVGAVIRREDMSACARAHGFSLCEAEERYPFLLHQRISRVIAQTYFGVEDERILSAIECHTTLKKDASPGDMALFLADKLAWDQPGIPPYRDEVEEAVAKSLPQACLAYMDYTMNHGGLLYPHVWWTEAHEWLSR